MFYRNLKTANKLILAFSFIAVIVVAALIIAFQGLRQVQQSQQKIFDEQFAQHMLLKDLLININENRALMLKMAMLRGVGEALLDEVKRNSLQGEKLLGELNASAARASETQELLQKLDDEWRAYSGAREKTIIPLIAAGDYDSAAVMLTREQAERIGQIRALGDRIIHLGERNIQQALAQSAETVDEQRRTLIIVITAILALMATIVWATSKSIAGPLADLTQWAEQIAEGDLMYGKEFEKREDEVGMLSQAFSRMGENLRELAKTSEAIAKGDLTVTVAPRSERDILGNAFSAMIANLQSLTADLKEGVAVLSTASQEIMASTGQVAASAQETATAISEITTTVEEVKQTATVSNQKAKHVTEAAQRTLQVSQDGRKAVEATQDSMSQIRQQMHAVAESIVRLSEQSQAIAEIVATVNDLAEQSNLLGVNASIEAVKSGEQGRGFSVVAQEVKTLADQSKQATGQVRNILNDIQRAMNKAVMVAEQGSKVVDGGYQQAKLSGDSIRMLADSIEESSGAALQIAASSQQQLVGMDQVASAMESIKKASQDNVEGTKQAEQAARNLHQLGVRMQNRIAQFNA
ncbi:Methyl-accepting chemotaxis protein [Hahella chejuensis KCTC 2396]|uniref:Methyl-accepting chemotaxis protein n=1 Tax=Hahella chejuensis (strain KCTC 2396) TaxID=349521 RepID=Q2SFJ8_HAHCH|nr:methyl-accepting chemotaxis protein [Hahella chejuensis]ABC30576.1 Methyl-accepting chemotaxis protein [Hahella chejuensis KCTC 2396]